MIHVVAIINTVAGKRDDFLAVYREIVPSVRAEAGCIEYSATVDVEGLGRIQTPLGPDGVIIIEKWETLEALKAHATTPHMATFGAKTKDIVASRTLHFLTPVD